MCYPLISYFPFFWGWILLFFGGGRYRYTAAPPPDSRSEFTGVVYEGTVKPKAFLPVLTLASVTGIPNLKVMFGSVVPWDFYEFPNVASDSGIHEAICTGQCPEGGHFEFRASELPSTGPGDC